AKDQLDKPLASPPIKIAPELVGEARWIDEKTLVLWPKADLPVSTRYEVTVPRGVQAIDGNELGEAFTFEFSTPRLTAGLDVLGPAGRAARDQPIRLSFNRDVPLEQVVQHCQFAAGGKKVAAKNAPDSASRPARGHVIAPAEPLAADTAWTVSCDAELRGR